MKRILLLTLLGFIAGIISVFAQYPPTGDASRPNAVTITTSNKLNVRSGAGQQFGIVDQINPNEVAYVVDVDDYENGWVRVETDRATGFVSTSYIRGLNGDYYQYVYNYNNDTIPASEIGNSYSASGYAVVDALCAFFAWYAGLPWWVILIVSLVLIAGEVLGILWLKEQYDFHESPGLLYAFIVPSFLIVLAILPMSQIASSMGREASFVWIVLLMCFLPLLINTCWILENNGKHDQRYKRSDSHDAAIGKTISIITMLLVVLPLTTTLYTGVDRLMRNTLGIPDTFLALVLTVAGMTGINIGLMFAWMFVADKLLRPLHNFSIMLLASVSFFIAVMAEKDIIEHFYGFYYFLAFLGWIFAAAFLFRFYKLLRCERCANCHRFEAYVEGTTDRGYNVTTSDSWDNISDSSIRSSRHVRNAQALNRTYTTWHNWTDHYCCDFCGHRWSMFESEAVASQTETLKKRWEEYD